MTGHFNSLGQPIGAPLAATFPRPRPSRTPMTGRLCSVVPVDLTAHAPALFDAFAGNQDNSNWTYLPYGPFDDLAAFRNWMETACTGEDPLFYTILDAEARPVGLASYLRIDTGGAAIEVGHINFAPRLQRTAAATEAMFLMMRRVFDELAYRRYEWKCDSLNAPSWRAAERLGFIYEGTFRKATHYKGRNRDTAWFAIVDDDWPGIRAAFEDWLGEDNFDADGRQKRPLRTHGERR